MKYEILHIFLHDSENYYDNSSEAWIEWSLDRPFSHTQKIEDEYHFVIDCPIYNNSRKICYQKISELCS